MSRKRNDVHVEGDWKGYDPKTSCGRDAFDRMRSTGGVRPEARSRMTNRGDPSARGEDLIHTRFLQRVHERVERLRKRIELYNLKTPLMDQQLMNVRPEDWVAQVRDRLGLRR